VPTEVRRADVEIVLFRRSRGNGGQNANKTATAVRMTHRATGIRVECCSERSQRTNLEHAYALMAARLERLARDRAAEGRRASWESKPPAARGHADRTYVLDSPRRVTDHRTGHGEPDPSAVLKGRLDGFLRASLIQRSSAP
jgi:peptide chain release factor 2